MTSTRHRVVVIGGGTAGITAAMRLKRKGVKDIAIIEPADTHFYQPMWTLVGGGLAKAKSSGRPMEKVIRSGVDWIRDSATSIDPDAHTVTTAGGRTIEYERLVVAPGIQLDWDKVPGMAEAIATPYASSIYRDDLATQTWDAIKDMRSGTAVFTVPSGSIKCPGAPQKIAYLAADWWRRQGVLNDIRIVLVLPGADLFGIPVFAKELHKVVDRYGIEARLNSEAVEIDPGSREVVVVDNITGTKESIHYDFLHTAPPQSAPDWLKQSDLAVPDSPDGFVDVDKHTMRHVRYPDIFALGDASSSPNSKTGAAIRKQAPVVAENLVASLEGRELTASYNGYASCPITTARDRILLTEFDYTMQPHPTLPLVNTLRERKDFGKFTGFALPALYWNLMLRGIA